ncbi:MAG TPA: hypothetical protein VMV83_08970 [Rectinemataceae bacterium]|nr:hypothetical protein [Rectinemataceae bacterium]
MRRFLSGILYLLIGLPITFSGLLALSLRPWAFDKTFYSRAIDDERLWTALRSPTALKGAPDKVEIGGFTFSGPALYSALQRHLPEAALKSFATDAVDSLISVSDEGKPAAALDLRPLKSTLTRDSAAIAADYFADLPKGDRRGVLTDFRTQPPGTSSASLAKQGSEAFASVIATIPDSVNPKIQSGSIILGDPHRVSPKASLDRLATTGLAASAALLLGLGFLGGGGIGRSLARTGKFLIIPSALVLAAGIALSIPGAPIVLSIAAKAQATSDLGFLQAIGGWLSSWLGVAARSFFIVGLSGISIGALLASVRRILEPREY